MKTFFGLLLSALTVFGQNSVSFNTNTVDGIITRPQNISGGNTYFIYDTNATAHFGTNYNVVMIMTNHSRITFVPPTSTNVTKQLEVVIVTDQSLNLLLMNATPAWNTTNLSVRAGVSTMVVRWEGGGLFNAYPLWLITTNEGGLMQTSTGVVAIATNYVEFTVPAGSFAASSTNGAVAELWAPTGSANVTQGVYAFDDTTEESIQFAFYAPSNWDGTLKAQPMWTAAAASGNLEFSIAANAYDDGDDVSALSWDETPSSDTVQGSNLIHYGGVAELVVGNSPAPSTWIAVRISRNTGIGSNMTGDALLLSVAFQIGTTTPLITSW